MTNVLRQIRNRVNAEARAIQRDATANYLIFRVEQYASDGAYPYLEQQQSILSAVAEQVEEDFPLASGEEVVYHRRPNCGACYVGVRLSGERPTEKQLEYLRTACPWAYKVYEDSPASCVVAYEVIPGTLFQERKEKDYYYWDHDKSQEIAFRPVDE